MEVSWLDGHQYDLVMKLKNKYGFSESEAEQYIADYQKAPMETVVQDIMHDEGLTDEDIKDYFEVIYELQKIEGNSIQDQDSEEIEPLDISIMSKVPNHCKRLAEMVLSTTTMLVVDIKPFIDGVKVINMDVRRFSTDEHNIRSFYQIQKEGHILSIVIAKELYSCAIERYDYLKNGDGLH